MTYFPKITAITVALTLACGPALAESFKRIHKEADFNAALVDKKITAGAGHFTIHSNGTVTGVIPVGAFNGTWEWQQQFFCRTVVIGDMPPSSGCQVIKLSSDGKTLLVIGDKGKATPKTFTIN